MATYIIKNNGRVLENKNLETPTLDELFFGPMEEEIKKLMEAVDQSSHRRVILEEVLRKKQTTFFSPGSNIAIGETSQAYLIFVISFTRAKFSQKKIYTEKRVNYKKRISRQNSVNQDLLGQAMKKVCKTKLSVKAHLVCVKLKKEYTQVTQIV